jgi:glycyl-tRNA synthetase beta chain
VTASNEIEGHRFMARGVSMVTSTEDWQRKLRERKVIVSVDERRQMIVDGLMEQAAAKQLSLVEDNALLDEVSGLVEWPVPLIGRIDPRFMTLPPEVRELSMKVNQRYFALRDQTGAPASFFAFVANIEADDSGMAIIAGNERVLRARLADAEHFWNLDRKQPLIDYLPMLKGVTFHTKLGTQYDRAQRIAALSREIADLLGADGYEAQQAEKAGWLAKADLVTGMVGEFPELQGIMGAYYAERNYKAWDPSIVGPAIRTHYQPKGPNDEVPHGVVATAVALADKLDTLREFFRVGEKPTGSSDPFALRRAALGVIRIIRENGLSLNLITLCNGDADLFAFLIERLRVLLRSQGERYDVLDAVFAAGEDNEIISLLYKTRAVSRFLDTEDGGNLLTAYRRAANILRIEDAKDGPHKGRIDKALLNDPAERNLDRALKIAEVRTVYEAAQRGYRELLADLATLRAPVDAFFEAVKINVDDPELRKNRLKLLAKLRDIMHRIADFSKIEG